MVVPHFAIIVAFWSVVLIKTIPARVPMNVRLLWLAINHRLGVVHLEVRFGSCFFVCIKQPLTVLATVVIHESYFSLHLWSATPTRLVVVLWRADCCNSLLFQYCHSEMLIFRVQWL